MSNLECKFKLFRAPRVEGLATRIWVATHYLRTPT